MSALLPPDVLRVDVWSDVVCPWCWLGHHHLEEALARFPHRDAVAVVWHSFELDPGAPETDGGYVERLTAKYGPQAAQMAQQMTERGAAEGLQFRFDRARSGSTLAAHRLLHLARERGRQDALAERLFRAVFTDGMPVTDHAVLADLAAEVGLDRAEAAEVLASGAYTDAVRADEALAARLGVQGVPFFVVGSRYAVSGAQPADVLLGALERAWAEREPALVPVAAGESGPGCEGDACAV